MIDLYSADQCFWSSKLRHHLDQLGVSYRNINVTDPDNAEKVFQLTGQRGFPVTVVGDQVIIGCDIDAVDKALENM